MLFFALFKPIILQLFTILQDKLHSFNIQDDRSKRFLCTTNYSIDHIKRFHEENSIMPGLFRFFFCFFFSVRKIWSYVICRVLNNYGLLVKTIKKNSQNHLFGQRDRFSPLTNLQCELNINRVTIFSST